MELIIKALLSGLFAGAVAIGVTVAIERLGGLFGSVLGTTPTTVIASSVGLASVFSGETLRASMFSIPPGMFINAGFLLVWKYLPPKLPESWSKVKRCLALVAASLSLWFCGAFILVLLNRGGDRNYQTVELWGYLTAAAAFGVGLFACLAQPLTSVKGTNKIPLKNLLLRGTMAFCAIATSVMVSAIDDVAAGFTSTFPAIFLTTQVSLYLQQTSALTISSVGPMILGSISVAFYAIVFALFTTQPVDPAANGAAAGESGAGLDNPQHSMNPLLAALASWSLSILCVSIPVAFFLRWRRAQCEKKAQEKLQQADGQAGAKTIDATLSTDVPQKTGEEAGIKPEPAVIDDAAFHAEAKARLAAWEASQQQSIKAKLQDRARSMTPSAAQSSTHSLSYSDDEALLPSAAAAVEP
jgi:hypothetical protein